MMRLAGILACLLAAGCATVPVSGPVLPAGARYVAMGSSYAAGAGIPPLASDRPARCGASDASYARLLARRMGLALADASCGGATTAHLLAAWDELPAQVEAVTADTRLVTITVGGNDLNYMGLVFAASCHAGVRDARQLDPQTGECRAVPVPADTAFTQVEQNLVRVVEEVRRRAPQARVVLVQYVTLADDVACPAAPLLPEHAALARQVAGRLAAATARAARATGADVLPVDELSRVHTPCSPEPWARALAPGYDGSQGAPWHPTAAGHAAIAAELERLLAG